MHLAQREGEIEVVACHVQALGLGQDLDADPRVVCHEFQDELPHGHQVRDGQEVDAQVPGDLPGRFGYFLDRAFQLFHDGQRALIEALSRLGQAHEAALPVKELHVEFLLQTLQAPAHAGFGLVQHVGRGH